MKSHKSISIIILLVLFSGFSAGYTQSTARIEAERSFVEAQKALARGDDQTAEKHLMKSLQLDPSFTSSIWQLSQIYEKRGKLEYARELLMRGLQQEPNAAWARDKLANLEKVLTQRLLSEADLYMQRGDYKKALPKLSLYLGIKPHDPVPLIRLGRCHLALGNLKTAREYLVQAIQRDPSNTEVAGLLDEIDRRISRSSLDAAVERARNILIDHTAENREEARDALREVLKLDPNNVWAMEKLEELAVLSKREKEAKEKPAAEVSEAEEEAPGNEPVEAKAPGEPIVVNWGTVKNYFILIVITAIAVLLFFNLRRRSSSRHFPLQGSLTLIPILDIVSLLNGNLKTGRLQIISGNSRGEIFFEKGEIVHARIASHDGRSAFHKLMDLRSGTFIFINHLPNVKHTISEPLSLLLLSMRAPEKPPAEKKASRPGRVAVKS